MSVLQDDTFLLVVDGGVIDSLMCKENGRQRVTQVLAEIDRVTTGIGFLPFIWSYRTLIRVHDSDNPVRLKQGATVGYRTCLAVINVVMIQLWSCIST